MYVIGWDSSEGRKDSSLGCFLLSPCYSGKLVLFCRFITGEKRDAYSLSSLDHAALICNGVVMSRKRKTKAQLTEELDAAGRPIIGLQAHENSPTEWNCADPNCSESEEKYRYLFEHMTQGVFYQRADGSLVDCNPALLRIWGISRDQFLGRTSMHLTWYVVDENGNELTGENHPSMVALKTGKPVINTVTGVYNPQKQQLAWAVLNATPQFRSGETKPYQVFVTVHEITDRKQAEMALQEREEQLRAITDNAQDGIIMVRPDGTISFWNPAAGAIFGYEPDEVLGKDLYSLLSPEHLRAAQIPSWESFIKSMKGTTASPKYVDFSGRRRDGTEIFVEVSLTALERPDGWHTVGIVRDVTERRQMLDELMASKNLLTQMGKIAQVGGWELDVATMKQKWTDETYTIHDREKGRYDPNSSEELTRFLPGSIERIEAAFQEALEIGTPYDLEVEMLTIAGNRKWVRAVCESDVMNGKVVSLRGTLQDITDRKQAEELLRMNQKDLEESQRIAHVGSWHLDVASNEVVWSEELYRIYGFDPTLPPPPYTEHRKLFTPDSWARLSAALQKTKHHGIPYELELETSLEDGTTGWMWVHGERVLDENGTTIGLRGAAQDITDRKRTEEAIRESEQRFRRVYDYTTVGLAQVSLDFYIEAANQAYCKMLGYSEEELVGKHLRDITHPETLEENLRKQSQLARGEIDHYRMEKQFIHKNGRRLHGVLDAVLIRDKQGTPQYFLGSVLDITERKIAENALKESEAKLASAVSIAQLGYWEFDLRTRTYTFTDSLYSLLGTSVEEMGGYQIPSADYTRRFVYPEDAPLIEEEVRKAIATDDPNFSRYFEHRILHADGTVGYFAVRYYIVKDE